MRHFFRIDEAMCLRAAEGVGAPVINMAHFLGQPVEVERLIEAVAGIVERAGGLTITLEFIPGTGVSDIGQSHRIAHAAGAKVMLDSWHLARSGGTLSDIEQLPAASIGGVQISDWRVPPPGTAYVPMSGRLLPGEGELPLSELMAAIEANSPRLDMCIEVFSAEMEALGWDEAARQMAEATRKILPPPL
jgi:sugar phosphate isomerase/epimerase